MKKNNLEFFEKAKKSVILALVDKTQDSVL